VVRINLGNKNVEKVYKVYYFYIPRCRGWVITGESFCCARTLRKIAFILQKNCTKSYVHYITRARVKR